MNTESPASVLITGATGAIGRALAEAYAAPGVFLLLQGRDAARLAEAAALCRAKGASVRTQTLDLADAAALAGWLRELEAGEPFDLVVANAGMNTGIGADGAGERWEAVEALFESKPARALITHRERQLKGPRARLGNARALELWGTDSGTGLLVYRWFSAVRVLRDLRPDLGQANAST